MGDPQRGHETAVKLFLSMLQSRVQILASWHQNLYLLLSSQSEAKVDEVFCYGSRIVTDYANLVFT